MLKTLLAIAIAIVLAVGLGAGSVWWMITEGDDLGELQVGQWTVNPSLGTPAADPYAKARFAREGKLALGASEGVQFVAWRDADGRPLEGTCDYALTGPVPTASFWTLHTIGADRRIVGTAMQSLSLLRGSDGGVAVALSRHPSPGNWLPIETTAAYGLVLAVYDAPLIDAADQSDLSLPRLTRTGCDG